MMEKLRIGLSGCAGVGKSSLARMVATELGISFLESKKITQSILRRDGYDYSSGIQVERFLANSGRQNEILRKTMEQEEEAGSFVTDRTVVDLAAYVVSEMHDSEPKVVRNVVETCKKHVGSYTHLFLCPWTDKPVSANEKRTLNPWYQFLIHVIEKGILTEWGCIYIVLSEIELEDKKNRILEVVR